MTAIEEMELEIFAKSGETIGAKSREEIVTAAQRNLDKEVTMSAYTDDDRWLLTCTATGREWLEMLS